MDDRQWLLMWIAAGVAVFLVGLGMQAFDANMAKVLGGVAMWIGGLTAAGTLVRLVRRERVSD